MIIMDTIPPASLGHLHDGVISLQLPESFAFFVSCPNEGNNYSNPLELQNLNNKEKTKEILEVV